MFLGCYSLFVGAMVTALSQSVIHDGVFFCNAPEWCLNLGVHLIVAPLIMKMLSIFNYFGKLGKRWSDGVLLCGILVIVAANIIFLTVWMAFGGITGINIMMLVTPEDSFPYYEFIQACNTQSMIF